MQLHIYPCFDSLLYFPIYLAIDVMGDNIDLATQDPYQGPKAGANVWKFNDLTVVLEPAAPTGDQKAIERLKAHQLTSDSCAIAICDPMIALQTNADQTEEGQKLKILGTFLDRVAIWGVAFYPDTTVNRKKRNRLQPLYWNHHQHRMPSADTLSGCRIGYCPRGYTTKYVLRHFLRASLEADGRLVSDGINIDFVPISDFGEDEIKPLFNGANGECDVVFTNTPWLAKTLKQRRYDHLKGTVVEPIYTFPAIPFPFTSVITTQNALQDEGRRTAITTFLQHMLVAIALAYRDPDKVVKRLYPFAPRFRHYGVGPQVLDEEMVAHAVRLMSVDDYLSEQLLSSWTSWDFAFYVSHGTKYNGQTDLRKKLFDLWDQTARDEYVVIQRREVADFLNGRLQGIIGNFIQKVDLGQTVPR